MIDKFILIEYQNSTLFSICELEMGQEKLKRYELILFMYRMKQQ